MLSLRNAADADFGEIQRIYEYAQDYMIRSGNPTQWGRSYPSADLIRSDLQKKVCKVIYDETGIHGVFALFDGAEPTYAHIEEGEWLNDEPYVTIHRLAGDGRVHGLFQCAADHCKSISPNVRVDTHANNTTMQRLIEKNGFKKICASFVPVADAKKLRKLAARRCACRYAGDGIAYAAAFPSLPITPALSLSPIRF